MNVISVSSKAETLQPDDGIVFLQHYNKLLLNRSNIIMPTAAAAPQTKNKKSLPPHEVLHNPYINHKRPRRVKGASKRKLKGWADTHSARRGAAVEEMEEKSGKQTSTDPKQKTQPDGDEEFCQYGLCCDACRLLWWWEEEEARLLREGWKKKGRKGR